MMGAFGEDQMDEAQMGFVERHLVGEEARAAIPDTKLFGAGEVVVAELIQHELVVAHPQIGQSLGILQRAAEPARPDACQIVDEDEFVAGRNQWMRCQRLLDHGGAGARIADDEDRLRHGFVFVRTRQH